MGLDKHDGILNLLPLPLLPLLLFSTTADLAKAVTVSPSLYVYTLTVIRRNYSSRKRISEQLLGDIPTVVRSWSSEDCDTLLHLRSHGFLEKLPVDSSRCYKSPGNSRTQLRDLHSRIIVCQHLKRRRHFLKSLKCLPTQRRISAVEVMYLSCVRRVRTAGSPRSNAIYPAKACALGAFETGCNVNMALPTVRASRRGARTTLL